MKTFVSIIVVLAMVSGGCTRAQNTSHIDHQGAELLKARIAVLESQIAELRADMAMRDISQAMLMSKNSYFDAGSLSLAPIRDEQLEFIEALNGTVFESRTNYSVEAAIGYEPAGGNLLDDVHSPAKLPLSTGK